MTTRRPIRIGFIGLQPGGSWGTRAHLPALQGLGDQFEVVGVANSTPESGRKAAGELGLPHAFDSVDHLVASPDVDLVVVTVKVPHHHALVSKALAARKHVYCEWPLGRTLEEARDLAGQARQAGVVAAIGTQALFAPEVAHLRTLLADGYLGEVLSISVNAVGGQWGATMASGTAYTLDRANGANLLTIPVGHTLAALTDALGPIEELAAVLSTRRPRVQSADSDAVYAASSPDQVLVSATLESGAPLSLHFRGGAARGTGLCWEIHGTAGDLRLTGDRGQTQLVQLSLEGGRDDAGYAVIPVPEDLREGPVAGNVRRVYEAIAGDIRDGTHSAPTFDDAVRLHQIITAIEVSAETGQRVRPADL